MVISNLNVKQIGDRLGFVIKSIARLRKLSRLDQQDFLKEDNPAIAESYLRRSLEQFSTSAEISLQRQLEKASSNTKRSPGHWVKRASSP